MDYNQGTMNYDTKTKNHHWGLIILVIVILVLVILYIRRRNGDDDMENEAFGPFLGTCTSCGTLSSYDCNNCLNCGFCITTDGRSGCVPGDALGPLNRSLNCATYRYRGRVVPYSSALVNPVITPGLINPVLNPAVLPATNLYAYDRWRFGGYPHRSWDHRGRSWDNRNRSRSWDNHSRSSHGSNRSYGSRNSGRSNNRR